MTLSYIKRDLAAIVAVPVGILVAFMFAATMYACIGIYFVAGLVEMIFRRRK